MASALDGCVEGVKPGCTKDVSWLPPQGGSGPLGHDGGAGGGVPLGGGVFVNGQCPCGRQSRSSCAGRPRAGLVGQGGHESDRSWGGLQRPSAHPSSCLPLSTLGSEA